jgi:hypothetical protein
MRDKQGKKKKKKKKKRGYEQKWGKYLLTGC